MRSYTSKGRQNSLRPEFELDGEVFRGEGTISLMDLSELARLAAAGFDDGSPEGIGMIADIYRSILGDQEFTRFRRHCREHDVDGKLLMEIIAGIIAEAGNRPTERPSDSPDGPPAGGGTARVVSLQRGTVEQVETPPREETREPQKRQVVSYG
ncbi:hypothetical protein AB0K40_17735 [Nonomuraea bangladeshensis]|uniref:Tail assembly chaperone n=1 Tax=Nonomuraea bangladeshensis TaxID=404385 RepID=A0ABV3H4A0_9ACTN